MTGISLILLGLLLFALHAWGRDMAEREERQAEADWRCAFEDDDEPKRRGFRHLRNALRRANPNRRKRGRG
jgi:hypothetical protein